MTRHRIGRRSLIPAIVVSLTSWCGVMIFVFFVDPYRLGVIEKVFFFTLVWIASLLTLGLAFRRLLKGVMYASAMIVILILRYLGFTNILLTAYVMFAAVIVDWYATAIWRLIQRRRR